MARRTELPAVAVRWEAIAQALPLDEAESEVAHFTRELFPQEMDLLQTIPGVGPTLAPWIIAILHPISRFDSYPKAKRYIGMNPRQADTGKKIGKQKISRTGNGTVRGLLYLSAIGQVGKNTRFGDIYKRKIEAEMPGKKAAVAVAESIFCVAYHVLKSGQPYHDPARPAAPPAETLPLHLVPQAEAARRLGVSRQAISLQVKSGKLRAEEWQGKFYVVVKYLEMEVERKMIASGEMLRLVQEEGAA